MQVAAVKDCVLSQSGSDYQDSIKAQMSLMKIIILFPCGWEIESKLWTLCKVRRFTDEVVKAVFVPGHLPRAKEVDEICA